MADRRGSRQNGAAHAAAASRAAADSAVLGYVHPGTVRAEFMASVLGTCMEGNTPVTQVIAIGSGPMISTARNTICRQFLEQDSADWLFMCDTDMWFHKDAIGELIAAADPAERPVMGALCFSQNIENGGGDPFPTLYELTEEADGDLAFIRYKRWPEDAVMQVAATGAAALLIHRTALENVAKRTGDRAAPWFRESQTPLGGKLIGEDLTFCLRCQMAGIPVHVHTGVKAGHMKTTMLI